MWKRFAVLSLILSTAFLALALDDQGNANNPAVNDRANACYEGGSMAGKCDTEWEWSCGWYLIRYEQGMYSREDVPADCSSLLPAESDIITTPSSKSSYGTPITPTNTPTAP